MHKRMFDALVLLGLVGVAWVALVHAATQPMVLAVCLLIGLVYLVGIADLQRYRKASAGLQAATARLVTPPDDLDGWLQGLDSSLRTAVRLRIAGDRAALPAPALPAYLSGVLVLLGMLGTLLGMMATLRGTGLALETASDLQAIRDSLAAPVKGLGYAFGTSIAGIASSAVLGLLTALGRRERLAAAQALDGCIVGPLQGFTRAHRRDAGWQWLQAQGALLPSVLERLQGLIDALGQRDQAAQVQQLARQDAFLAHCGQVWVQLADDVRDQLRAGIAESTAATTAQLRPLLQEMMVGVAGSAREVHGQLAEAGQAHLRAATDGLQATTVALSAQWSQVLAQQQAEMAAQAESLRTAFAQSQVDWTQARQAAQDRQDAQRLMAWQQSLEAMAAALQVQWQQAGMQAVQQQQVVCAALQDSAAAIAEQGRRQVDDTLAEVGKLLQAASEAPRAAAGVIGELRQSLSDSLQRDTTMLAERNQLLATLGTLMDALQRASGEQQAAVAGLVGQAGALLEQAGARFDARIEVDARRLDDAATRAAAGALEIAGIGDAFGSAVDAFALANAGLADRLERLEGALEKSLARSDEQLAYYVAQAREVVDLSLLAQRQIVADLRRLGAPSDTVAAE